MRRILFVDDEVNVLNGLRRLIRKRSELWQGYFAESGLDALALMRETPIDVLVTDMRMPRMDGAALLRIVNERYPNTVRIVLSGYTELEAAIRAVPIAHQFLVKPCEPDRLCATIDRACALHDLLQDGRLGGVVSAVQNLPSVPRLYQQLVKALATPTTPLEDVGKLIEQDPSMVAKLLQLVNSAFFGLPRRVTSVLDATSLLGTAMLRNLVLSVEVFNAFDQTSGDFDIEAYQREALRSGFLAMGMFQTKLQREDAFTAGVLHDIGRLLIASRLPQEHCAIVELSKEKEIPVWAAEQEVLGATHAELGAYLLGLWGLPYAIVEAAAYHHASAAPVSDRLDVPTVIWIANLPPALPDETVPEVIASHAWLEPHYTSFRNRANSDPEAA